MADDFALLFTSLWFFLLTIMLSIAKNLFCFECIGTLNTSLIALLCILCSHEIAVTISSRFFKVNKSQKN